MAKLCPRLGPPPISKLNSTLRANQPIASNSVWVQVGAGVSGSSRSCCELPDLQTVVSFHDWIEIRVATRSQIALL